MENRIKLTSIAAAIILLIAARNAFCQPDAEYICDFGKDLSINTFFGRNIAMFDFNTENSDDGDRYTYVPNNSYNVGVGFSWKGFSFDAALGLPYFKNENASDTKSSDFQFYYYARKFLAGFFWQDYEGFYTDSGNEHDRPDISMVRSGIFGEYVFNSGKLSYKAAFDYCEQQMQSAGSFLLGGGVYYTRLEADYDFSDVEMAVPAKQKVEIWQFGPSVGYGYTWVPAKYFSVTGSISLGVNVSFTTVNGKKLGTELFPSASPKVSIGYNNESWGINFIFLMNMSFAADVDDENFTFGTGKFALNFVKRFSLKSGKDKNEQK